MGTVRIDKVEEHPPSNSTEYANYRETITIKKL